jgi:parvulin-like peptidyl-prolyl isomerase
MAVTLRRGRDTLSGMPLIINGEEIEGVLLEQEFSAIKAHFESLGNVSCCERDEEFRGYARDNIIARVLLAQEAERTVEPASEADIDAAVEQLKADHGGEAKFAAATGYGPEHAAALRDNVHTELRLRRLVERLTAGDQEPTDAQLRAFYDEHLDLFKTVEEVQASHILKAPRRGEDREAAYQQLREAREKILAGADFHEIARTTSDKPENETDLGHFKRGDLMEEFERVAFSMRVGEVSPVFAS